MTNAMKSKVFKAFAWLSVVGAGALLLDSLPLLSAWTPGKSDILLGYITGWVRLMSLVMFGLVVLFGSLSGFFFWLSRRSMEAADRSEGT
jgi:hypothetical protein